MSGQGISNQFVFSDQPTMMDKDPKGETFLYCHGNSVIIRNLASPQMVDIYTQHSCQVSDIIVSGGGIGRHVTVYR